MMLNTSISNDSLCNKLKGAKEIYKLMIVEDEPFTRAGLKKYFNWKELGVHTIVEAENGKVGLTTALIERPDLVITDIRMPIMDGLEMIGQLRPTLPNTQFIILSGHNEFEYAQKALHYGGVYDYLLKPLQYDQSLAVITNCLAQIGEMRNESRIVEKSSDIVVKENQLLTEPIEREKGLELFIQIEAYIEQHINQDLTLNKVAEHFFYNPSYLSRLFKSKLNQNYMSFVSEIRIKSAQKYLENPNYSVAEVSEKCGYKSYKHFVKVFKRITNLTPTEYRKQLW